VQKLKKRVKRKVIIFFLVIILVIGIFTLMMLIFSKRDNTKSQSTDTKTESSPTAILNDLNTTSLIKEYGATAQSNFSDLRNSSSETWDKTKVDKVYFNLIFADRVGSFSDVFAMLSFLQAAKQSGINIDDNSFNFTQSSRDEIRTRAEISSNTLLNGSQR
jgi:hypothetical protein